MNIYSQPNNILFNQDVVTLQFCAKKLDRMDFFGKSDPFLTFERCLEDGS